PTFNEVTVYHETKNRTDGINTLGPYTLDSNSLYVNGTYYFHFCLLLLVITVEVVYSSFSGYHEEIPAPVEKLIEFTLNFTVTNLPSAPELTNTSSPNDTAAAQAILPLLNAVFSNTSISKTYRGCEVVSFRQTANINSTTVDAICRTKNDSTAPAFDREKAYDEFSESTDDITRLGNYTLNSNSLYVDAYNLRSYQPFLILPLTQTGFQNYIVTPTAISIQEPLIFNVTFTVTNLNYSSALSNLSSEVAKATSENITALLNALLKESTVSSTFKSCTTDYYRPAEVGTAAEFLCTFENPNTGAFNEVTVYHEIKNKTQGINTLGPYKVDNNSLYVNGYHEASPLPTFSTTFGENLTEFTLNFTMKNLPFTSDLTNPASPKYTAEANATLELLNKLFSKTSISKIYRGCKIVSFRPSEANSSTTMDAICTINNDSTVPVFDRKQVYNEISNETNGIVTFGNYTLNSDSLYVNVFKKKNSLQFTITPANLKIKMQVLENPPCSVKPDEGTNLLDFTVNFIITNLPFEPNLKNPESVKHKSATTNILYSLDKVFNETSISQQYKGCKIVEYSSVAGNDDTKVDAICTIKNDSTVPFDRVKVYHEFSNQTNTIQILTIYSLNRESLYIDGNLFTYIYTNTIFVTYNTSALKNQTSALTAAFSNPSMSVKPVDVTNLQNFTVNCTVTNLAFESSLKNPDSEKYKSARSNIIYSFDLVFSKTSIRNQYKRSYLFLLRAVNGNDDTKVDAVCTIEKDQTAPFDRKKVYQEFSNETNSIQTLTVYNLNRESLYVDDFDEVGRIYSETKRKTLTQLLAQKFIPLIRPGPPDVTNLQNFTVNFTITNLAFEGSLKNPESEKYKSATTNILYSLGLVFSKTSISKRYKGCKISSFSLRAVSGNDDTKVNAVCTIKKDQNAPFDRKKVFQEFSGQTNSIQSLTVYSLNRESLYVDGYHELPLSTTTIQSALEEEFTVNFTIINLAYSQALKNPNSARYKSAEENIKYLLQEIFKKTYLEKTFKECKIAAFRPVKFHDDTTVDAICTVLKDSPTQAFDRVKAYEEFSDNTKQITSMEIYNLNSGSLYINALVHVYVGIPLIHNAVFGFQHFTVNFTITNLAYSQALKNPNSAKYNSAEKNIKYLLDNIFQQGSLKEMFQQCKVMLFRPVRGNDDTTVDSVCTFKPVATPPTLDKVKIYQELKANTKQITELSIYTLNRNSLYVNGYNEANSITSNNLPSPVTSFAYSSTETPIILVTQSGKDYALNFTITNLVYSPALQSPSSSKYKSAKTTIIYLLEQLFQDSMIKEDYISCRNVLFKSASQGRHTRVESSCRFKEPKQTLSTRVVIYNVFKDKTENITKLGQIYNLDSNSLFVDGRYSMQHKSRDLGFNLNFTIASRTLTSEDPNSPEYKEMVANLTTMLETLFKNSKISPSYKYCRITGLRIGSVKVKCQCFFDNENGNAIIDGPAIEKAFAEGTNSTQLLGGLYQL
uniref:SEA domain-containing protein n=1 Tax=Latimeria chalumnae TaxID=7897 RepID=H2ZSU9_LATCH